jgi:hypothetical protein
MDTYEWQIVGIGCFCGDVLRSLMNTQYGLVVVREDGGIVGRIEIN